MKIYKPVVKKEGTSDVSIAEINAIGNTALITKEYADATYTGDSGNLQKEVTSATYTILNSDNKHTIIFNRATAITVTLNTLTTANFECSFYNEGVGSVTFVGGTATLGVPDGTILATDKVAAIIRKLNTTTYKLKGELS